MRQKYEQTIADMLQKQSLRLDATQENECQQLKDRLKYELDILMAYQNKNRMQAQAQRDRERKELEDRVSVRRSLLESKVCCLISFRTVPDMSLTCHQHVPDIPFTIDQTHVYLINGFLFF